MDVAEKGLKAVGDHDGITEGFVQDAAQQARAGRLFVVEHLPFDLATARYPDAYDAIRSGALRPPFPVTFILATLEGSQATLVLGISDTGFVASEDEAFGLGFAFGRGEKDDSGFPCWRRLDKTASMKGAGGALSFWERLQGDAIVILSLIADSRSSVTRVVADDKLNKARIKNGKAPIPPYWRIEAGPTVLIPGAIPKPATAKGGTHASPRPHDRRGHPRNLKSGRTVWVRECKINALLPHLTRTREFYAVKL